MLEINSNSQQTTSEKLRELLDYYFDNDSENSIEKLLQSYFDIMGGEFEITFIFREKKYFKENKNDFDFLLFPYFSFKISPEVGLLHYNNDRTALEIELKKLKSSEFELHESKYGFMQINRLRGENSECNRIFNLTKRLLYSFYINSGAKAHFLKSVSDRAIKKFWSKEQGVELYDFPNAIKYIGEIIDTELCLFAVEERSAIADLDETHTKHIMTASSSEAIEWVEKLQLDSEQFNQDFESSILRKNLISGTSVDYSYCFNIFTDNYVAIAEDNEVISFKIRPEYAALFISKGSGISVDCVNIARNFLNSFITFTNDFNDREYLYGVEDVCKDFEFSLSADPVADRDEFILRYHTVLLKILDVGRSFMSSDVCIRILNPSTNKLESIFSHFEFNDTDSLIDGIPVYDLDFASSLAFKNGGTVAKWHPKKLFQEKQKTLKWNKPQGEHFDWQSENADRLKNALGSVNCSIYALPLHFEGIVFGVVEFSSTSIGNLQIYRDDYEQVADLCQSIYRRLELANDRGWLVRMHFLHAARHRIEQIARQVEDVSEKLAENLLSAMTKTSVSSTESFNSESLKTIAALKQLKQHFIKVFDCKEKASEVEKMLAPLSKLEYFSRRNLILLAEFISALGANKNKHGFEFDAVKFDGGILWGNTHVIKASYEPTESWIAVDRAKSVCLAPLKNKIMKTENYNYGLFLLGTQVRMSGGWILSHINRIDGSGTVPFGFTILLDAEQPMDELNV